MDTAPPLQLPSAGIACPFALVAGAPAEWTLVAAVVSVALVIVLVVMQARHRRRFVASNAALRESQQLLASVTENIAEAIYRTEPNGRLVFVNRAYLRLFGYGSIEELNAVPREHLYARPEDRRHLLRQLEEKATFANEELEFVRKDGTRFWGLISSTATRDAAGRPVFFDGIISDVTARRLAETNVLELNQSLERRIAERTAELSASEARLRTLVDHAPEAIVVFDDDTGRLVQCNAIALDLYGVTEAQLFGMGFAGLGPELQPDGYRLADLARERIKEALSGGTPVFEWMQRHSSGNLFSCEIRLVRLPAEGRRLVCGGVIDITERKRAQDELLKALAHEKELGLLKTNFVSMVSHEFRTPLGIIMSSAQILTDYGDELGADERSEQLTSIHRNVRRMASLMDEVLLLGRVEAGRMEFKPGPVDLDGLCRRLADEVLSATDARCPIVLSPPAASAEACLDERLLNHVFTNLLSNAVKYSPAGAPVQFRCATDGDEIVFIVHDEGMGIPEADQPSLFQAFRRGRNVENIPGTGLGLTIVKRCLDLHGGHIRIDSAVGRGTTVTVRVPARPHRPATLDPAPETAETKGAIA